MSENTAVIAEAVADIVASVEKARGASGTLVPGAGELDQHLWQALQEAGMTGVGIVAALGGSDGDAHDAAAIVATLARAAAPVPIAEHLLVAGPALASVGLSLPEGGEPVGIAAGAAILAEETPGGWVLRGRADDVAWGTVAPYVVVPALSADGAVLALVETHRLTLRPTKNLAGEPRSGAEFDDVLVDSAFVRTAGDDQIAKLSAWYAVARSVQIGAALDEVLTWTVNYTSERVQFGRPLSKLATVQGMLAQMAGEAAIVAALVDSAIERHGAPTVDLELVAAAAKIRASMAVRKVTRAAHQIHGAIGYTLEHRLHTLTTRLWSWCDEAGGEAYWADVLGGRLIATPDLWPALVDSE
jgi:alkylation response protein AidB-like acyl-CoA dehydrogenase